MIKFRKSSIFWHRILLISICLNIIVFFYIGRRIYYKYKSSKQDVTAPQYFLGRDKVFEALPLDTNDIVFLGNSLTQNFMLSEYFSNPEIKNRGISGDNTSGVLNRLHSIVRGKPAKVFLMLGVNDLGHGKSVTETLSGYRKIVESLLENGQTKVFIQSVLPVSAENPYGNINDEIIQLNKELIKLALELNISYIDLYSDFIRGDELNPDYHIDGIHLNAQGYILWKTIISEYL